jgi:type IV fimbrial biogenesis protein FimT
MNRFFEPLHPKRSQGIFMVELMVVLAIAALLLGIGIPGFIDLIRNQRLTTTVNEFFVAVNLARSEAITRGARVDLVPAGDGTDWARGWVVLIDRNNNQKADDGDQIIYSHGPVPDGIAIKAQFPDPGGQYLAYAANGHTRTSASSQARRMGHWLFTLDNRARKIVINFLGRPRTCDPNVDPTNC